MVVFLFCVDASSVANTYELEGHMDNRREFGDLESGEEQMRCSLPMKSGRSYILGSCTQSIREARRRNAKLCQRAYRSINEIDFRTSKLQTMG